MKKLKTLLRNVFIEGRYSEQLSAVSKIVTFLGIGLCAYQSPDSRFLLIVSMLNLLLINYSTTLSTRNN